MDSQNIVTTLNTVIRSEKFIKSTLDNTALVGNDLASVKRQISNLQNDVDRILSNQQVINENVQSIIRMLSQK